MPAASAFAMKPSGGAGVYSVVLDDYQTKVELTTTTRAGFQRYTFPEMDSARVLIDPDIESELRQRALPVGDPKGERYGDRRKYLLPKPPRAAGTITSSILSSASISRSRISTDGPATAYSAIRNASFSAGTILISGFVHF